jgi:beta-glucosidase/6-phospho-beta-glucosidase/beta-galactosidase
LKFASSDLDQTATNMQLTAETCDRSNLDSTFSLELHPIIFFEVFNVMMQTPFSWFNIYPQGMEKTVTYVKDRYNNTPMFITENGKQVRPINVFRQTD